MQTKNHFIDNQSQIVSQYMGNVKKQFNTMRIPGTPKTIPFTVMKFELNILEKSSVSSTFSLKQVKDLFQNRSYNTYGKSAKSRIDGLDIVKQIDKLVVFAGPGSGKTTFLKYIGLKAVEKELDRIPVFVDLSQFSKSGKSLIDFIKEQFENCGLKDKKAFVEKLLLSGSGILLFDGLDEVSLKKGLRDRVIRELLNFVGKYEKNKYIITCRVCVGDYLFDGFTYTEIAYYAEKQILHFVKKYFNDEKKSSKFFQELEKDETLKFLSRNPLLLRLICSGFGELRSLSFNRYNFFSETLSILLEQWENSQDITNDEIYKALSLNKKHEMFEHIAYETFRNKSYIFLKSQLEKMISTFLEEHSDVDHIDPKKVLKTIEFQHRIIHEWTDGHFSFGYPFLQKYYAARYIVKNVNKGTLEDFSHKEITDNNWREVFLLIAGGLENADKFFEIFIDSTENYVHQNNLGRFLSVLEKESKTLQMDDEATELQKKIGVIASIFEVAYDILEAGVINPRGYNGGFKHYFYKVLTEGAIKKVAEACGISKIKDGNFGSIHNNNDFVTVLGINTNIPSRINLDRVLFKSSINAVQMNSQNGYDTYRSNFVNAVKLSHLMKLEDLSSDLLNLKLPASKFSYDDQKDWEEYGNRLYGIFLSCRAIRDYHFVIEHEDKIRDYLHAITLLLDCLKIAKVTDQKAIENRLFCLSHKEREDFQSPSFSTWSENFRYIYHGDKPD